MQSRQRAVQVHFGLKEKCTLKNYSGKSSHSLCADRRQIKVMLVLMFLIPEDTMSFRQDWKGCSVDIVASLLFVTLNSVL